MFKHILAAAVAIATSLTFMADQADAFGGRGHARRHARRAIHHHAPAPVVVQRVYAAPVVSYYRAPVYYHPPVSVHVGRHHGHHRSRYYGPAYPSYGGVSIGIGW